MSRATFFFIMLLILEWYSIQALRVWTRPFSPSWRTGIWVLYGLGSLMAYGYLLYNIFNEGPKPDWWRIYGMAGFVIWILSKVPIGGVMFLDDIRRVFSWGINQMTGEVKFDPGRSRFMAKAALALGAVPFGVLTYGMARNGFRYRLHEQDVPIAGLPEELNGLKIVQISDIHSGTWTDDAPVHKAVELINEQAADLVCFTGDLVNSLASEMAPFVETFSQIKAKYGVYSVMGNHDYGDYYNFNSPDGYDNNRQEFFETHRAMGWDLLMNENRLIDVNGRKLAMIGVENWSALRRFPRKGDLAAARIGTEEADVRVLMSHDPTHWEAQVLDTDIDLTLSGHTHGFQFGIEIPGFKWSPAKFMYKQWAGIYKQGQQWLYVNRGLGCLVYPGRVGILPEVTVLKLVNKA
ncbi:MAG: metallophosphoesterase [Bacteroidota bacterium]